MDTRSDGDWTILDVQGEVDLYTAPHLRERLLQLVDEGHQRILVNMQEVGFMDSSGLGVLVACLKRARERGGDIGLVCKDGSPFKVLSITGLDKVFAIYGEVGEATGG